MKLDLLVLAAHPDDAELCCSGAILSYTIHGKKAGIVDLTRGELGTRGTVEDRQLEAEAAGKILGLSVRENLGLPDGYLSDTPEAIQAIISVIRKYQPDTVLINALYDRHTDHGKGGEISSKACFLSGLVKIETLDDGNIQDAWRPKNVYHFIQDRYIKPDFVLDITPYWEKKKQAIGAFKSQFFNPNSTEPQTYISSQNFMTFIEARALEFGHSIGVQYGEGFCTDKGRFVGIKSLESLI
jgi:bacillithiol biosynthesis deacetylase BshB1